MKSSRIQHQTRVSAHPYRSCVLQNSPQGIFGGPHTKISGWSSLSSFFTPAEFPLCPAHRQEVNVFSACACENPTTINVDGVGTGYPRSHAEFVMLIGIGNPYAGPRSSTAPCSP